MSESVSGTPRRPSLHDVAAAASVSVSTVSRYLSGQLALKAATEARVRQAMADLGYRRAPRGDRAETRRGVIGLVVPSIGNPYFARIADAVVKAAERQGVSVLICSTLNHARKQLDYVETLAELDVSGIVYAGSFTANRSLSGLIEEGRAVVVIDEALELGQPVDTVLIDDYAGAYHAVAYLTNLGHQRIALVTGSEHLPSVRERTRAYRDALTRAGLPLENQVVLHGSSDTEWGVTALSHLLAADEPPTAVFAASDTIAVGMMTAARSLGVRVPEDLSIVGFDDAPDAALVSPALTTVRTPVDRMGEAAVELLIARIDEPDRPVVREVIGVALVARDSCAAPTAS